MKIPIATFPSIEFIGHSSLHDYAPTGWLAPCREYDLTDERCDYEEAIEQSKTSIKN